LPTNPLKKEIDPLLVEMDIYLSEWYDDFTNSASATDAKKRLADLSEFWADGMAGVTITAMLLALTGGKPITYERLSVFRQMLTTEALETARRPELITRQMTKRLDKLVIKKYGTTEWIQKKAIQKKLEDVAHFKIFSGDKVGKNVFLRETRFTPKTYSQMYARTRATQAHVKATINQSLVEGLNAVQISSHGTLTDICKPHEGQIYSMREFIDDPSLQPPYHPNCLHIANPFYDERFAG